ncbi:hypothetical protein C8R45DRAFT_922048 [Mycena sanguinolenta]|nr:hypothetical protein C8R45DRAFT_922048 [Mycena sanguinolenta]
MSKASKKPKAGDSLGHPFRNHCSSNSNHNPTNRSFSLEARTENAVQPPSPTKAPKSSTSADKTDRPLINADQAPRFRRAIAIHILTCLEIAGVLPGAGLTITGIEHSKKGAGTRDWFILTVGFLLEHLLLRAGTQSSPNINFESMPAESIVELHGEREQSKKQNKKILQAADSKESDLEDSERDRSMIG